MGERVKYVITQNGQRQVSAKAEPLISVAKNGLIVDRHFYLTALRKAVDGLFLPIIEQRFLSSHTTTTSSISMQHCSKEQVKHKERFAAQEFNAKMAKEAEHLLWSDLLHGRLTQAFSICFCSSCCFCI